MSRIMQLKPKKVWERISMTSSESEEPPTALKPEVSFPNAADSVVSNTEKFNLPPNVNYLKTQADKNISRTSNPDYPDIASQNKEWRVTELQKNNKVGMDFSINGSDDEEHGPPILSPQVETIQDEGKSILNYQFELPEDVGTIWAHPNDSKPTKSSTASSLRRRSSRIKRNSSELVSILQKPAKRQSFTYAQYEALFAMWEVTQSPRAADVLELVHITGLSVTQVRTWFTNKRRLTRQESGNNADQDASKNIRFPRVTESTCDSFKYNGVNSKHKSTLSINDTDPSSRGSTNNTTPTLYYTKQEKRQNRVDNIKAIPHSVLEECMETSRTRISQLILLFMKRKLDMRRTLLRETTKLKEKTVVNPFRESQVNAMRLWRDDFFAEVCKELNEDKKQQLSFVKLSVIGVWHPLIIYGKLTKVSLETAIDDFSHQTGVETQSIADSEEFTVPGILRYMESHF